MSGSRTFVIVGAGLAGARAAETLRAEGFDGRLVLFGDEAERPYERPPLSKGYLGGGTDRASLCLHPEGCSAAHGIELHPSSPVGWIDPAHHRVELASGEGVGDDRQLGRAVTLVGPDTAPLARVLGPQSPGLPRAARRPRRPAAARHPGRRPARHRPGVRRR